MQNTALYFFLVFSYGRVSAQQVISIGSSTNFFIANGTTVSLDSLLLLPSSGFNLVGSNNLFKNVTTNHTTTNLYIQRVYSWANTTPAFTGTVGIFYLTSELNGIASTKLTLNIFSGLLWNAYTVGVSRSPNSVWTSGIAPITLNEMTLADKNAPLVLPLLWGPLHSLREKGFAKVDWTTYNEADIGHFEMERSVNALQWQTLSTNIASHNKATDIIYTYSDYSVPDIKTFYRIKAVDINGSYKYSPITSVGSLPQKQGIIIYPNPADDHLWLSMADQSQNIGYIELYTADGKIMAKEMVNASKYKINTERFSKGTYIIKASAEGQFFVEQFVKR